eukprot:CAMPEP_0201577740 /NCGR_PEP_ID=MMETSP0190_2-20130828/24221_1 /ASSEMBLY_ACC=CAM_ASM_000263 /TAXON_ID=37353 /ORGANISM="Rosalina sp." /LENGTH=370 /DNA_ID=CAMNT_0048010071 /DNA_START=419 /DNA_END=1531 /DNA_ORIENTATION=+
MNESMNENNSEYNEIMANIQTFEQDSETSQDVDFSAYDGSTFLEQQSISISTTTEHQQVQTIQVQPQTQSIQTQQPPPSTTEVKQTVTISMDKDDEKESPVIVTKPKPKFQEINNENDDQNKNKNESNDNQNKDKDKDMNRSKMESKTSKPITSKQRKKKTKKTGPKPQRKYKYDGSAFIDFYLGKNESKPIYCHTMLYCTETQGQNEEKLKEFLKKYGHFKNESIGTITFKSNRKGEYALIRVNHLPLKSIKQKIKTLNKSRTNGDVLSIFQSKNVPNYNNGPSSIVFIYNFDVTGVKAHRAMTDLLLTYGDFKKDISIRTDKNGDPFAIVYFKTLMGAQKLFYAEQDLKFGGRQLTVSFSQYAEHLYK